MTGGIVSASGVEGSGCLRICEDHSAADTRPVLIPIGSLHVQAPEPVPASAWLQGQRREHHISYRLGQRRRRLPQQHMAAAESLSGPDRRGGSRGGSEELVCPPSDCPTRCGVDGLLKRV